MSEYKPLHREKGPSGNRPIARGFKPSGRHRNPIPSTRFSMYLPCAMLEQLRQIAFSRRVSVSALIREGIQLRLAREMEGSEAVVPPVDFRTFRKHELGVEDIDG